MSHDGLIHPSRDWAEQIAALEAQVNKLKEEAATADKMYDAQYKKFEELEDALIRYKDVRDGYGIYSADAALAATEPKETK